MVARDLPGSCLARGHKEREKINKDTRRTLKAYKTATLTSRSDKDVRFYFVWILYLIIFFVCVFN